MNIPNNQVLRQISDFDCECGDDFKQPFEQTDIPKLWVELPILGSNIVNGTFASSSGWTVGANWSIGSGKATYTSGASNALTRDTDITLVAGYYLVKFDFVTLDSGRLNLTVSLGGQTVSALGAPLGTGFVSQTIYLFKYLTPSNNEISFSAATYDFEIDNVEVYRLSEAGFKVKDCDTDTVAYTDDGSNVSYFETGNISNGENLPTVTDGYAIVSLNFADFAINDGCYYICFNDNALSDMQYVRNGVFDDSDFWTISNTGDFGWTISGGLAQHVPGGAGGDDVLSQEINLSADLCYLLTAEIANVSGSGNQDISIYYDTDTLTDQLLTTITVSAFPYELAVNINNLGITNIKFVCTAAGIRIFSMDNVSITESDTPCEVCVQTDCFSLRSWDAYCEARRMCNIKITGYNDRAWGFPDRYSFIGRFFGKLRNAKYHDVENVDYKDLSGLLSLQYNDNEKIKELQIYEVPERTHDWLRLALRCKTLTLEINGVSRSFVKVGGDYTPNWRKTSTLAPVIIELKETSQVAPNI